MMTDSLQPGNLVDYLHDEDYERHYAQPQLTHETMFCVAGRPREQLNGRWLFTPDACDMGLRSHWYRGEPTDLEGNPLPWDFGPDDGEEIDLPSCWNMLDAKYFHYEGSAWYSRRFRYIPQHPQERVFLRVGAANYETKVFLNQEFLGTHRGGSTPFFVELTGKLDRQNLLQFCVNNTRRPDRVPMKNTDWFNYGGIYRDVELIRTPQAFITDFSISLAPNDTFQEILASVHVSDDTAEDDIQIILPELGVDERCALRQGQVQTILKVAPELWSPERPRCYAVEVRFRQDRIAEKVGFRHIAVQGNQIVLNRTPIFLRGISVHEDDEALGKTSTREDILRRFAHVKELGGNFVRLAHYPHHELAAQLADEVGLLLWEEIPVYWAIQFDNPQTYADAENQLLELIKRDRNRASVIIWSVGNENADTDARLHFMSSLAQTAKRFDPSRLVSAACLVNKAHLKIEDRLSEVLDIIGVNEYYGWYEPEYSDLLKIMENSALEKPIIITETGAGALAGQHGSKADLFSEEHMAEVYARQIGIIRRISGIQGMSPWVLYDFRTPRRGNRFQRGYNRKGLIAQDKTTKKLAFKVLQQFYQEQTNAA